jgi:hypothetical protein
MRQIKRLGEDKREELASELEELVRTIRPEAESNVELEKLKAGLSILVEDQKARIADASVDGRTWLDITRGITPIVITALLGGVGSAVTLVYQSKQHAGDLRRQQLDEKATAAQKGQELQASQEAAARLERTELLERLAQSLASGPAPAASCWYAAGIWADYSRDEPLPQVLASRCVAADAGASVGGPTGGGSQWVTVVGSTGTFAAACAAADSARDLGLEVVQVMREDPPGLYVTTAGEYSNRSDAVGYLQRVRSVRANAFIARSSSPKWSWCDCTKAPPLACAG